jgi:formylglycine-generating enzyme required for sulfatase activity
LGNASDLPQIGELFSCQAAQESWEGAEFQQGVFTHFLLAGLKGDPDASTLDGLVTFDSLQQYVRGKVKAYTAAHFDSVQEPIGKSTLGSMVLAREQGEVVVKPVDALAHIHVTSEPPGAKVYVDGQVVGITPCTLDQDLGHLKTKQVEITVEARDYKSVVRTASMERGGTAEIDCPLERTVIPVVPIAHLNVVTNPPGARVFAGDQEIAGKITPCVIDFNMATQLQWQGIVTVVLGDLKASQEVSLEPNKTTELNLALQRPLPKPVIPATPTGGGTRVNPKDGAEMVFVPAGHFLMGEVDIEQNPCRTVTLDAFWIYKNDVTVAQYRKFCQATGRQMPQPPGWGWKDDHPVVNVTLENAEAYCRWAGMALPTKAQWEKAARGTDGRRYPWGNEWDPGKLCCSVGQHRGSTAPVGSYPAGASPYGCMDMAGNVWQWCADWYGNPASRQDYVLRGGSWNYNFEIFFRCGSRGVTGPVSRDGGPGFRCAVRADLN